MSPSRAGTHARFARPRLSRTGWALLAIAMAGAALRLLHLGHDLPWFLDEALPLRQAMNGWAVAGHPDWNPHRFHYPGLVYDLHLIALIVLRAIGGLAGRWHSDADFLLDFTVDPTPVALTARALSAAADVVTILAVGRAGERLRPGAGLVAAAVVACAGSMIRASRLVYTDTFLATFAVLALERLLAWRAHGGATRLWTAAFLAGLAAGAKYPGFVLLVPMWVEIARRERGRAPAAILVTGAIALGTFLLTTPWAILDRTTFLRDVGWLGRLAGEGHLGDFERRGFGYHLANLVRDLGMPGVLALAAAFARPLIVRRDAGTALPVALAFLALAVPVALAKIEVERYLVPILPFAALLAAWGALAWCAALPAAARRAAAPVAAALIVLPPLAHGAAVARTGGTSTQVEAARWCEAHVGPGELVLSELYGPPLTGHADVARLTEYPVFQSASGAAQERARTRRQFAFVLLPAATTGSVTNPVRGAGGDVTLLEVARQAADLNGASYDPRLLHGVSYVITSSAMRGRYVADAARFPQPLRLYALLDRTAEVAARFEPHGGVDGPGIVVYRLGARTRAAVAEAGALDPLWWTSAIPAAYRARAQALIAGSSGSAPPRRAADGTPAAWVRSLAPVFADRFAGFATAMAIEHRLAERPDEAWPFASAILEMDPANAGAYFTLAWAAHTRDAWGRALPLLRRSIEAQAEAGPVPPEATGIFQYALAHAGTASPPSPGAAR